MTYTNLVDSMLKPDFYPHKPDTVRLIQTHISFVFIAGSYVFKVKKAVDLGFLDFSSLEKRKYYCLEELRLNRRLAHDIYLDVVTINEDEDGILYLNGENNVVEYAVRMKRLPEDKMLYRLLEKGTVTASTMDSIARKVYEFHKKAPTGGAIDKTGGIGTIRQDTDENFEQTKCYINITIPEEKYRLIKSYTNSFLDRHEMLFRKRATEHKIRDCHGDLHLEHICITDDIIIFDCIEFNKRFRYLDVAAEVAFLSMDLDFNGYANHSHTFIDSYIKYSSDTEIRKLLIFYKCYFAYVRGKVTSFKTNEAEIEKDERNKALKTASKYFELSYAYVARLERPSLILISGLMGTGKSLLAGNIAPFLDADIIRTDVIRKRLLDISVTDHHFNDYGEGIYSGAVSLKTYAKVLELAEKYLKSGRSVIIDASFKSRKDRLSAHDIASRFSADFFIVECKCPQKVLKKRLELRLSDSKEVSDGRWEIFEAQKKDFEKIDKFNEAHHIVINTSKSPENCTLDAIRQIRKFCL